MSCNFAIFRVRRRVASCRYCEVLREDKDRAAASTGARARADYASPGNFRPHPCRNRRRGAGRTCPATPRTNWRVDQKVDALPRRLLAARMLRPNALFAAAEFCPGAAFLEDIQDVLHGASSCRICPGSNTAFSEPETPPAPLAPLPCARYIRASTEATPWLTSRVQIRAPLPADCERCSGWRG